MRTLYIAVTLLVAGFVLTGCTNQKLISQKDREIEARDQMIADLQQEIAKLQEEVGNAETRADRLDDDLQSALGNLQEMKKLSLSRDQNGATITMPDAVTFASGSANLTGEGQTIIDKVWGVLSRYPDRKILIEGHTDNVPIAPEFQSRFRSNWELSTARALAVVHYVRTNFEADPKRLAAVGFGEHQPVADNATEVGRGENRRVVIVVANPTGDAVTGN